MNQLIADFGPAGLTNAPWITALGWALIHFLWQGAAVGLIFAGGDRLLRNARPQARYTLGLLCLMALLVAPLATAVILYQQAALAPVAIAWPESVIASQAAAVANGWNMTLRMEQGLPWLVLLWALGFAFMAGRVGLNWHRMVRCTRVGVRTLSADLLRQVAVLKTLFDIRRPVAVLESTLMQVPTVLGWLRPVILLPTSSLVGLTPAQLELVIAHELGHIRRYDYLVNLFQIVVETLFYYHPVVGWISRRVRHEREQCCDDLVIARCGNRIEYARALANLESMRSGYLVPALAATEGKLVQRIERIVCAHGRRNEAMFGNSGLVLLIAGLMVLVGQLADPMAAFEDRRNRLAEVLVAELMADQQDRPFVALDQASFKPTEPTPVALAERLPVQQAAPHQAPVEATQNARPLVSQRLPVAAPGSSAPNLAASADRPVTGVEPAVYFRPRPPVVARKTAVEPTRRRQSEPAVQKVATGPVAIQKVSPEYPVRARISGQQGYVAVEFTVAADGRVSDVQVSDSRPRRVFDRAAMRAIKDWRFDPATVSAGNRVSQRFDFTLHSGPPLDPAGRNCLPLTGTRICRPDSPTSLMAAEANLP